jgi:hypothetical protein
MDVVASSARGELHEQSKGAALITGASRGIDVADRQHAASLMA